MADLESLYDATIGEAVSEVRASSASGTALPRSPPEVCWDTPTLSPIAKATTPTVKDNEPSGSGEDSHQLGIALRQLVDAQLRVCENEVGTLTEMNAAILGKYRELDGPANDVKRFIDEEPARQVASLKSTLEEVDEVYESVQALEQVVQVLEQKVDDLERRAAN